MQHLERHPIPQVQRWPATQGSPRLSASDEADLAHPQRRQYRCGAARMVGIAMRHHHQVDARQPQMAQEGHHHALPGIRLGAVERAGVIDQGVSRVAHGSQPYYIEHAITPRPRRLATSAGEQGPARSGRRPASGRASHAAAGRPPPRCRPRRQPTVVAPGPARPARWRTRSRNSISQASTDGPAPESATTESAQRATPGG